MNKYKVAIVGAGNIASGYDEPSSMCVLTHAHAILNSESFELAGFHDIDKEKMALASKKWHTRELKTMDDVEREADIVCVAVPDQTHFDILQKCADFHHIKAVIAEKPITKTLYQAKEVVKLYGQIQIPVFVNYSRRYTDAFISLKQWIEEKGGCFISGSCYYGKGLHHNCSHLINIMDYLFGNLEVCAVGNIMYDYFDDDPSIEFRLEHHGAPLCFYPIPCKKVTVFEFDLFFENGRVRYLGEGEQIEYYNIAESDIYAGEMNYKHIKDSFIDLSSPMNGLYKNVSQVLSGKSPIACDLIEAERTLSVCEAIRTWSGKAL